MNSEPVNDQLPEDLQPGMVDMEDYLFPDNARRRIPGLMYLIIGFGLIALALVKGDAVFTNRGFLAAGIALVAFGIYSYVSGWPLVLDEQDALVAAGVDAKFTVGHASAQMGWRGILSRPVWRILLYSAEEQPKRRAFIMVDGVDGSIVERIIEDNPEDWAKLNES